MAQSAESTSRGSGNLPTIAVSMGDPLGVGPEVIVKALADPGLRRSAHFVIHGLAGPMLEAAESAGIEPFWWRASAGSRAAEAPLAHSVLLLECDDLVEREPAGRRRARQPSRWGGQTSHRFVAEAIIDCRRPEGDPRRADAIATGPISKESWVKAGRRRFAGHTDLLQAALGARRTVMMFDSPALRVALATHHIPLMDLRNELTIGRVFDPIDLGAQACRALGVAQPRVGVCGMNPHAGERGLFGDEESRLIEPAIRLAREAGIDAHGPFPADTLFRRAAEGEFHLVIAMYHDQGLIPIKLLARDKAVNLTLGLPTPRTSPAHGTAFDIAGRNRACAESMQRALTLAVRLASARGRDLARAAS